MLQAAMRPDKLGQSSVRRTHLREADDGIRRGHWKVPPWIDFIRCGAGVCKPSPDGGNLDGCADSAATGQAVDWAKKGTAASG